MIPRFKYAAFALGLLAVAVQPAQAQLSAAGIGAFAGATVINFNGVGDEAGINSQYIGQGVSFGGSLFGMTNSGDTGVFPSNGGGTIASNWLYSSGIQGTFFTAAFSTARTRVGFWLENWSDQTGVMELFLGSTSLGTLNFGPTAGLSPAEFFGVSSVSAFDNIKFTNSTQTNGFFAIDDFQFDGTATTVPEPSSLALVAAGMISLIGAGVRRRRSA